MSEMVHNLPKEVLDFVAECRQLTYALDPTPNLPTHNPYEWGFRFEKDGLELVDISTEQDGKFAGMEYVAVKSQNPGLNGKKFYICQYAGADLASASDIKNAVRSAQHGLVMEYPTLVRFGAMSLLLRKEVDGLGFVYSERSHTLPIGTFNRESLSVVEKCNSREIHKPVYKGSSQFTLFEIK